MKVKEIIFVVLLVLPATLALLRPGFFGVSDDMHIAWLQQMDQVLKGGQIPPRYVADLSFGFGYPLFNFIFPLPYYLGELFHLTGLSFVDSIKAVFVVSLIGSAITMYFLARHLSGKLVGLAATVVYVYTPYRSTDIYVRGALGEALAFVFLPLIVFFIIKVFESKTNRENYKWIGAGGLSVAGLVLTHNIVSYMFIPFVFLLGIVLLKKKIISLFLFFTFGLLGSLYFWLPALLDSKLMKYETVFNFFDHFPTIKQLIIPFWGYGASVPGPYDGMSFFVGEINLIIMGVVLVLIFFKPSKITGEFKKIILWCLGGIFFSIIMMNFRSGWIWERVPLIVYFQFPWRFLTLVTFGTSLLVVIIGKFKYFKIWAILIIVLAVAINFKRFKPNEFLSREDSYFINRYIPVPKPSSEYLTLKEEYLRLPKATTIRPRQLYPRVFPETAFKNITLLNSLDTSFVVESSNSVVLSYNKYYFPGWSGLIDGKTLDLYAGDPYGQIQFSVPAGVHNITIRFGETSLKRMLDYLSLATIMGCIFLIFWPSQMIKPIK